MTRLWWLSFADPHRPKGEQFLGVSIIEAPGFGAATLTAHILGCNPGGEVQGLEIHERFHHVLTPDYIGRLLTRAEIDALGPLLDAIQGAPGP